jgi:UDP-glucose 4-epimerase
MPYIMQVAVGRLPFLSVYGDDYPTPDGTGVRDYIHVVDLVVGHLAALEHLEPGCTAINLGTGRGYSVLEILDVARRVVGHPIPHRVVARRPGDIAACYADPTLAADRLGWRATRALEEMIADHWRWQEGNPAGYR